MNEALSLLEGRVCCPDDDTVLSLESGKFRCSACTRTYQMQEGGFLDLAPTAPSELAGPEMFGPYVQYYKGEFADPVREAWGAPEQNPKTWVVRKQWQVEFALPLVLNGQSCESMILVDFSGGAGYHTMAYAKYFKLVIHCDLSFSNLVYTRNKAKKLGIENIIFVRMDYLRHPFVSGLERIICFDTLVYGAEHERRLLAKIYAALSPSGTAVVDFHNWWHNPIRRLGFLRSNCPSIGSHSKRFATKLLTQVGISSYEYFPFYQELPNQHPLAPVLSLFIPPTRLTYRITKSDQSSPSQSRHDRL